MIVTADGWLSMAARGCPDLWIGPPRIERIVDEAEIEALCGDNKAWCYVAYGYTAKTQTLALDSLPRFYGYFTQAEHRKAKENKLPAGENPGNQAIWRANKKWVRATFPDCRQHMITLSEEWMQRADGVAEAQAYIDAEYRILDIEPEQESGNGEGKEGRAARAERVGKGKRSATKTSEPSKDNPKNSATVAPAEVGEGTAIDLAWLDETLQAIHWTQDTAKSWLATKFKVDGQGQLSEVISRLSREQAEEFVKELQERAANVQPQLFD